MSQTIRTFGAGLLASAWLAQHYQMVYLHTVGETDINYAYDLAIRAMGGSGPAEVLGLGGYVIAVYLLLCLGAGMLLAGFLWPLLETTVLGLLGLPAFLWRMCRDWHGEDSRCQAKPHRDTWRDCFDLDLGEVEVCTPESEASSTRKSSLSGTLKLPLARSIPE